MSRQNWPKGDGLKRSTGTVAKWELEAAKPEKDRMRVHLFAEVNGIPYTTFQTHITPVDGKRIKPGSGVGKKPLLDSQSNDITVDVLVRKDRVNQGVGDWGPRYTRGDAPRLDPRATRSIPPAHGVAGVLRPPDEARRAAGHNGHAGGHHCYPSVALAPGVPKAPAFKVDEGHLFLVAGAPHGGRKRPHGFSAANLLFSSLTLPRGGNKVPHGGLRPARPLTISALSKAE